MWPTSEGKSIFIWNENGFALILMADFRENKFSCIYFLPEHVIQLTYKKAEHKEHRGSSASARPLISCISLK